MCKCSAGYRPELIKCGFKGEGDSQLILQLLVPTQFDITATEEMSNYRTIGVGISYHGSSSYTE